MDLNYICQCECEKPSMAVSGEYVPCHLMWCTARITIVSPTVCSPASRVDSPTCFETPLEVCFIMLFAVILYYSSTLKFVLHIFYCLPRQEANSSKCSNGNGTFACGQCVCNKER